MFGHCHGSTWLGSAIRLAWINSFEQTLQLIFLYRLLQFLLKQNIENPFSWSLVEWQDKLGPFLFTSTVSIPFISPFYILLFINIVPNISIPVNSTYCRQQIHKSTKTDVSSLAPHKKTINKYFQVSLIFVSTIRYLPRERHCDVLHLSRL
jgi:hypothetical protein